MGPVELFVGSVAGWCRILRRAILRAAWVSLRTGLSVDAEWSMAQSPHRVGRIDIGIHLPHRMTAEQKERLLKVAHGCTVHQSIVVTPNGIKLNRPAHQKADGL